MKKLYSIILAFCLGIGCASAQFTTGGKSSSGFNQGGGNSANTESYNVFIGSYTFNHFGYSGSGTSDIPGININGGKLTYLRGFGVSQNYPMFIETGANLFFGAGTQSYSVNFEYYGYSYSLDIVNTFMMASLSVPANFAYRVQINDFFSIKPYAGINAKVNLLGKFYATSADETSDWEDLYSGEGSWNRFQIGWQFGVDFEIANVVIGLSYGTDFIPAFNNDNYKVNSSTFDLRFGYIF